MDLAPGKKCFEDDVSHKETQKGTEGNRQGKDSWQLAVGSRQKMKVEKRKLQITNHKLQTNYNVRNYKLQTVGAKNFSPLLRAEKNADVQFSMTDNRLFLLTLTPTLTQETFSLPGDNSMKNRPTNLRC